jgi:hypothetical protein
MTKEQICAKCREDYPVPFCETSECNQLKYEKPKFEEAKGFSFIQRTLNSATNTKVCLQCSGCHGCR